MTIRIATLFLQGSAFGGLVSLLPFILMFAAFYFLVLGPQRKRQRALQETIAALKAGDKVITTGGIIATVTSVRDTSLIIRTADKSMLEISRAAVAGLHGEEMTK